MSRTDELTIRPLRGGDLGRLFPPTARWRAEQWLARQKRGEMYVAVAELDGVAVGRCGLNWAGDTPGGFAYVWAAHVEPAFQSRGIGTALIAHLEDVGRKRGIDVVRLGVGKDNPRAEKLYRRLGYVVCGEETARWYEDRARTIEVVEECWTLEKRL